MASSRRSPAIANRLADDDAVHRDDRRLGAAAADVDDHVAAGGADGNAGADRRGERLRHEVGGAASAGLLRGVAHGALLDAGNAGRNADHDLRLDEVEAAQRVADEVAQHRLGDQVVGDDAVAHRPDDGDAAGRASDHPARVVADGDDGVVAGRQRHDRRLVDDDALCPCM